jgi:hypothetical protein
MLVGWVGGGGWPSRECWRLALKTMVDRGRRINRTNKQTNKVPNEERYFGQRRVG